MRKYMKTIFIIGLLLINSPQLHSQRVENLGFEKLKHKASSPSFWYLNEQGCQLSIDTLDKHSGNRSLKMESGKKNKQNFGVYTGTLPINLVAGKQVELKGWIKTLNVKKGYAGLWLRVDGANYADLGFDNMEDRGLKGNNEWTQVSIGMAIDPSAVKVLFGGLLTGSGSAWFDELELYIDGVKYLEEERNFNQDLSEYQKNLLRKYVYPLRTCEPGHSDDGDLQILNTLIGDHSVVALGEVSHGSSEIFKMKNRIIQYLAANKSFDIFSIEGNMPEAYKVNEYIVQGKGEPKNLIAGMYFWTWSTDEVLNLVQWMNRHNSGNKAIEFTGFDMQYFQGSLDNLKAAFKQDKESSKLLSNIEKQLNTAYSWYLKHGQYKAFSSREKKKLSLQLDQIVSDIEVSNVDVKKKDWLKQHVRLIAQFLELDDPYARDRYMAENFLWIKETNPASKSVIWAHNGHIQKTSQTMGEYLSKKLGEDYVNIGFTFYDGSYTAYGDQGLTSYTAEQAYPGTLEYALNQLDEPIFILDLKKMKADAPAELTALTGSIEMRGVGAIGGLENEFFEFNVIDDFDYLIFIKTSTPSKLFEIGE